MLCTAAVVQQTVLQYYLKDGVLSAAGSTPAALASTDLLIHARSTQTNRKRWCLPRDDHLAVMTEKGTLNVERCSLFLPLRWGAGPMALMLWLNLVI
jgi:hypothetical protein